MCLALRNFTRKRPWFASLIPLAFHPFCSVRACVFSDVCACDVCVHVRILRVYAFAHSRHWKHLALQTGFKGSNELRSRANWDRCERACISVGTSLLHDDRCNARMFRRFTSANSFKPEVEETLWGRERERESQEWEKRAKKKIINDSIDVTDVVFFW